MGSDVSLTGSAASITAWRSNSDSTVYTATITPTTSGTVTIAVAANVATDAARNGNTVATAQSVIVTIVDTTQPGVSISVETDPVTPPNRHVTNGPYNMTITFTEVVSGFEQSDLSPYYGRATISDFKTSDNKTYTAKVTPELYENNRYVRFEVPPGAATDAEGNPNIGKISDHVYIDFERPNTFISIPDSNVETRTFTVEIKFARYVSWPARPSLGFNQSDLSLTNNTAGATVTGWSSSDEIFTATITATKSGSVTFYVAEGVATDRAGNENTASLLKTVTVTLPGSDPA